MTKSPASKILLSRFLTRSGDQAWEFAVPLTLVYLFPENPAHIALVYLFSKLGSMILQPWVASVIDRWKRLNSALFGTVLQLLGILVVTFSILLLFAQNSNSEGSFLFNAFASYAMLSGLVVGSVLSSLGGSLMDIALGNDWVPVVISENELPHVNSRLRQIDLATEVGAPVIAGALLAGSGAKIPLFGFLAVALWNTVSFIPEILLLRSVFLGSPVLQNTKTKVIAFQRSSIAGSIKQGWHDFRAQPTFLAMIAFALLWLSALSPHGVLLTGFLKGTWAMPEFSLGVFRALGALFGYAATILFPFVRHRFGLVKSSLCFILWQTLVLNLSVPFFLLKTAEGWVFMGLILFSRIGLYGFSLGETELRQRSIAEGYRGKVNGVATSLTSLATLTLFGICSVLPHKEDFFVLVLVSVGAVTAAAGTFFVWSKRQITAESV